MKSLNNQTMTYQTRVFRIALFSALAAILQILESYISLPLPFFRIGLANAIILLFVIKKDYLTAFFITLNKSLLGSFFTGKLFSVVFLLSLSGSITAVMLMILMFQLCHKLISVNMISISGAVVNNLVQYFLFIQLYDKTTDFSLSYISSIIIIFSIIAGWLIALTVYHLEKLTANLKF